LVTVSIKRLSIASWKIPCASAIAGYVRRFFRIAFANDFTRSSGLSGGNSSNSSAACFSSSMDDFKEGFAITSGFRDAAPAPHE